MATEGELIEQLISCPPEAYGDQFQAHLLEQYKLFVQSVQQVSDRRVTANNYLLTINSTLVTLYGIASATLGNRHWYVALPIAGILICITWYSLVQSYKELNTAKFRVIHEMEKHLPASLFRYEWHACTSGRGRLYIPLTHIERIIPVVFALLYIVLGAFTILEPSGGTHELNSHGEKRIIAPPTVPHKNANK
jgi:hypothetical protein